jgi:hypothetical protein
MRLPQPIIEVVRRAILDLLTEIGGEHNDDVVARWLVGVGHRVARREVRDQLRWLHLQDLVSLEEVGPYLVARVLADGRDVSNGLMTVDGISRHKTGD